MPGIFIAMQQKGKCIAFSERCSKIEVFGLLYLHVYIAFDCLIREDYKNRVYLQQSVAEILPARKPSRICLYRQIKCGKVITDQYVDRF